jgi:hypothetical protein
MEDVVEDASSPDRLQERVGELVSPTNKYNGQMTTRGSSGGGGGGGGVGDTIPGIFDMVASVAQESGILSPLKPTSTATMPTSISSLKFSALESQERASIEQDGQLVVVKAQVGDTEQQLVLAESQLVEVQRQVARAEAAQEIEQQKEEEEEKEEEKGVHEQQLVVASTALVSVQQRVVPVEQEQQRLDQNVWLEQQQSMLAKQIRLLGMERRRSEMQHEVIQPP